MRTKSGSQNTTQRRLYSALACCTVALSGLSMAAQADDWSTVSPATQVPAQQSANTLSRMTSGAPVHVVVSLKMQKKAELKTLIDAQRRAGSPAYGRYLDADSFNTRYAPTEAQAERVASYLRKQGFVNVEIAPNRMLVSADGSAATASQAFNTTLDQFSVDQRSAVANTRPIQVPSSLADDVEAVLGLQSVHQHHTMLQKADRINQGRIRTNARARRQAAHGFAPTDFPKAYGLSRTPDGRNTTVGIITAGDMSQTLRDLSTAQRYYGMPSISTDVVQVGRASSDTSGTGEWDLDSQNIQAMAGGRVQNMIFYATTSLANSNITAAYNKAVSEGRAKIVNVSLGECETYALNDGSARADDQIFMAANAQGMMFSVSSGDSGSHECPVFSPTRSNAKQSYPAVSPYVIAVGGTSLFTNRDGSHASESAWVDGGGGPSTIEGQPAYQNGIVPGNARGVPDVALDGDPQTGSIIIVNGRRAQYGGTSLSSPLFVGLYARIESATGNSHDFPVPSFYNTVPNNPSLFYDVTSGNNGGSNPYTAGRGWDYTTGFGSPVGDPLYQYVSSHPSF